MKNKFLLIQILSLVAIVNAAYLSYKAYFVRFIDSAGLTSFCDFSSTFACTDVLRHPLSQVFGLSFPWIALIVYPVIFAVAFFGHKNSRASYAKAIVTISFLGMLFNGFIIYREAVFIHAYCLLCLLCTVIIVTIFALSFSMVSERKKV